MSIRIVLADDHQIVRDGLRSLIEEEPGMEVVGEVEDGRRAVAMVCQQRPDVVIMDIAMPDLNGVEATRQIRATVPEVKVVALSMHTDKRFVADMLQAGASAYLVKQGAFRELAQAIREVVAQRIYLSPMITGIVVEDYVQHLSTSPSLDAAPLTPREREVLQLLAEGKTTPQIASRLNISKKTVGTHRQHIMDKLDIHNIAELTQYAVREGMSFPKP